MINEFMNTPYEVHAFMIAFIVSFTVFTLVGWAFIRADEESIIHETIISILMFLGIIGFLYAIPEWVMRNNLYKEPHYALLGMFGGLVFGFIFSKMLNIRLR